MQTPSSTDRILIDFIDKHKLAKTFLDTAHDWLVPIAEQIKLHQDRAKMPFFVGVNGCQGSGKSTLTDFLLTYLQTKYSMSVVSLSLDDFYFSKQHRDSLAFKIHPLLSTRGVPGTHDTELLGAILDKLKNKQTGFSIPRFDKSTDNPVDPTTWPIIETQVDIVLMEGWCWGVDAQPSQELIVPVNELERLEDEQGIWRSFVNQTLINDYQALYQKMDYWIMLKAPSFSHVLKWRLEQEHKLSDKLQSMQGYNPTNASGLMSDSDIARFIQYYQRLTQYGLETLPHKCDLVFGLDENRKWHLQKGQL